MHDIRDDPPIGWGGTARSLRVFRTASASF
jgi:hypothetical protein